MGLSIVEINRRYRNIHAFGGFTGLWTFESSISGGPITRVASDATLVMVGRTFRITIGAYIDAPGDPAQRGVEIFLERGASPVAIYKIPNVSGLLSGTWEVECETEEKELFSYDPDPNNRPADPPFQSIAQMVEGPKAGGTQRVKVVF